ncbi:hypothetical protein ACXJJ3_02465 [Kribbella sp. WER1]
MRAVVVFAFVALGPGLAIVRRLDVDPPMRWLLVITTSLAVTAVVSEAFAIAQSWTATAVLCVVAAFSVLLLPRRRR